MAAARRRECAHRLPPSKHPVFCFQRARPASTPLELPKAIKRVAQTVMHIRVTEPTRAPDAGGDRGGGLIRRQQKQPPNLRAVPDLRKCTRLSRNTAIPAGNSRVRTTSMPGTANRRKPGGRWSALCVAHRSPHPDRRARKLSGRSAATHRGRRVQLRENGPPRPVRETGRHQRGFRRISASALALTGMFSASAVGGGPAPRRKRVSPPSGVA